MTFTTTRPAPDVAYTMVVVAPPTKACSYGHRGIAPLDCGAREPRSVAIVSDCQRDVATCAALVSHELGHTLGLVHSTDERDLMFDGPSSASQSFRDEDSVTVGDDCGLSAQNAHRALLETLGPR